MDTALQYNIQVRQGQLNADIAKDKYVQSIAAMAPSLNGNASHGYSYGRKVDPFTNEFTGNKTQSDNFSLSSSVALFEGFQLKNTVQQSRLDLLSGKSDVEKIRRDVSLSVASAYLQVLLAGELLASAAKQMEITGMQRDRTKKMVNAGSLPPGSLLDMEAQLASEELRLVTAQNQLDLAYLNLAQLLNLRETNDFAIEKPLLATPSETLLSITPTDIYNMAVHSQPEIKSSEYKLLSALKGLSIARGARSPRLSLSGALATGYSDARQRIKSVSFGSLDTIGYTPSFTPVISTIPELNYTYETTPFKNQIDDNLNKSLSFNLTIPIFNGWQTKNAVSRAKISVMNARLSDESARNQLFKNIQQAHADAVAAYKKHNASLKNVQAMRESFKYAEQKYNVGLLSTFDYMNSKNNLAKAESDLLQAQYEYIFKIKTLELYMGKPLSL